MCSERARQTGDSVVVFRGSVVIAQRAARARQHLVEESPYIYAHTNTKMAKAQKITDYNDEETGIEMADDSDIQADHKLRETKSLLGGVSVVRRRSCLHSSCRVLMGIMATAVFCFMLIQLWSSYGDDIKARVFSPQIAGAGKFTTNGGEGKMFGMHFHKWTNSTLHVNMSKPENDLVQIDMDGDQEYSYKWEAHCLQITLEYADALRLVVWSI